MLSKEKGNPSNPDLILTRYTNENNALAGGRDWRQQRTVFFKSLSAPAAMSAAAICCCPYAAAQMSAVLPSCAAGSA